MTILLIIFLIYIIGCVLAFGRSYAQTNDAELATVDGMCSWIGFGIRAGRWLDTRPKKRGKFLAYPSRPKILPEYDFENRVPEMYSWR